MLNPQTIKTYHRLRWEEQPDLTAMGVFFAFSNEQFNEGVKSLTKRGFITDKSEVKRGPAGSFGTLESLTKMMDWYDEQDKKVKAECDPQEVYFGEFNNHETPYGWDGDIEIMKIIVTTWDYDTAVGLKRYCRSNDKVIAELKN